MTRWRISPLLPESRHLATALGIAPITAQVLALRGYRDPVCARAFLSPSLGELTDPDRIPGLPEAARVVLRAARAGAKITVYGDYDADGVCATAILVRGLRALGFDAHTFIPHRMRDGYGLAESAVRAIAEDGTRLLVAVDCGIGAVREIALARRLGMEVVVIDHHEPPPVLPEADAVVDPKVGGSGSGGGDGRAAFSDYCASGLAWMLVRALRRRTGAAPSEDLLELVALATIADVVPLVGDNRILTRAGLERLAASPLVGVRALLGSAGLAPERRPVSADDVAWKVAPRINASGRVESASEALTLLLTDDPEEAGRLADALNRYNVRRQQLQDRVLAEAVAAVTELGLDRGAGIVVWGQDWHAGVVGIAAARVRETFYRPSVLLAVEGEVARGSARGVPGLNLVEALHDCRDLLDRFGGHASAAGVTVAADRLEAFRERFERAVRARLSPDDLVPVVEVDAEARLEEIDGALAAELESLAPFGAGNPRPVIALRGLRPVAVSVAGGEHLRLRLTDGERYLDAFAFRGAELAEVLAFTEPVVDVAGSLERDRWGEVEGPRLLLEDLQTPGVDLERVLSDAGVLTGRLFERSEEYLSGAYRGIEEAASFYTKVVGVTFEDRQAVVGRLAPGEPLVLEREPDNPHDPHAIRVRRADGEQVGYLAAVLAGRIAPTMDRGARYRATVTQVTGGGDRSLGVNVLIERIEEATDGGPSRPQLVRMALAAAGGDEQIERLGLHLLHRPLGSTEPRQWAARALHADRTVLVAGPGRGAWVALLLVAAARAIGGERVVCLLPTDEVCDARWEGWRPRLASVGVRAVRLHGTVGGRERTRALEAVRSGQTDVVFTTLAYLHGGDAEVVLPERAAVVGDGFGEPTPPEVVVARNPGPVLWCVWDPRAAAPEGWMGLYATQARTGVRIQDRRGSAERGAILDRILAAGESAVVFESDARSAVQTASNLRARAPYRVTYDHDRLPRRIRQTLYSLLSQGKIRCLVCAGAVPEEAEIAGVRHLVWLAPPSREGFLLRAAAAGRGRESVTMHLLYGPADAERARRAVQTTHPTRATVAAVYRILRRKGSSARWPDADLAEAIRTTTGLDPTELVPAVLEILEQAGILSRERVDGGWTVNLPEADGRRDLGLSIRFAEGERTRAAREEGIRWSLAASAMQILEAVAAPSVASGAPSGAG
ncbi:MAG: single-stranded-DNA-specific exonuclease RecJ [Armatimonadota bacterium]|nr:single-stranded-DNA-specific exonuclease RecJ [Armatimonadota bacterium]